jgi:hypothetical protein
VHLNKAVVSESEGGKNTAVLRSRRGMYSYPSVVFWRFDFDVLWLVLAGAVQPAFFRVNRLNR